MDTVVVAVDGSKHSEKVVDFSISLAKGLAAKILLVNVPAQLDVPDGYRQYLKIEGLDESVYFRAVAETILRDSADRVKNANVPCETISGKGNIAKFVLDIAESRHASLVVVGLFGLHRVDKVRALGSNARRLIENSRLPVVCVP